MHLDFSNSYQWICNEWLSEWFWFCRHAHAEQHELQPRCSSTVIMICWYFVYMYNLLFLFTSHLDAILKSTDWITKTESTWVKPSLKSNPSERRIFELALLSNLNGDFFFLSIYTHVYIFCQQVLFQTDFVNCKYVRENMYPEVYKTCTVYLDGNYACV